MEYLSYSQISKFKKCPFAYATGRIKKALPSVATDQGQNKHAIIEEYLRNGRQGELPKGFGPRLGAFLKYTLPEVSGLETKFDIDIFGYKFKGVIDAHMIDDDRAVVTDWKNHKSNYVEPDQLKLYALAVANANPDINYFDCYFYYLIPDFKEAFEFTRAEIDNYSGELLDIAGAMEQAEQRLEEYKNTFTADQSKTMSEVDILIASGAYKCKPGPNCKSCDHVEQCPENKKFEIPVITSAEQAKELSQKLYAFEAFADTVKDRIKTYMLENSIDELPIDDENRYYIMYSAPQLKTGKIKTDKPKTEKPAKKKKEEKPVDITGEAVTDSQVINVVTEALKNDNTMAKAVNELNAAFQKAEPAAEAKLSVSEIEIKSAKLVQDMAREALNAETEIKRVFSGGVDITVDDNGQITNSTEPELIGIDLGKEAVANIPDGAIIPSETDVLNKAITDINAAFEEAKENPDPANATSQLFETEIIITPPVTIEMPEKPKRKRESTAERIARLAAAEAQKQQK